jgi:hypothetical protein
MDGQGEVAILAVEVVGQVQSQGGGRAEGFVGMGYQRLGVDVGGDGEDL